MARLSLLLLAILTGQFGPLECGGAFAGSTTEEPCFVGRLVDFAGTPFAETSVEIRSEDRDGSEDGEAQLLRTDAEGRFRIPQRPPHLGRRYEIRLPADEHGPVPDLFAYQWVVGPQEAVTDWGDVFLLPVVALDVLRFSTDEQLRSLYERNPERSGREFEGARVQRHSVLREMARRGASFDDVLLSLGTSFTGQMLRARARGEPDPAEIEVDGLSADGVLEFVFPEQLRWRGRLRNHTLSGIWLGRFELTEEHLQCLLDRGEASPIEERRRLVHMGLAGLEAFPPGGGKIEFEHFLEDSYSWIPPGEYRARAVHTPDVKVSRDENWEGVVREESPPFRVRMTPLRLVLSRREVEQMEQWIQEIDVSKPPILCLREWSEALTFREEPGTPEDRIFRSGLRAVPVLIDRLGSEPDEARREWICALLVNLTGRNRPAGDFLAAAEEVDHWPTAVPTGNEGKGRGSRIVRFETSTVDSLDRAVEAWTRERAYLDVTVIEGR